MDCDHPQYIQYTYQYVCVYIYIYVYWIDLDSTTPTELHQPTGIDREFMDPILSWGSLLCLAVISDLAEEQRRPPPMRQFVCDILCVSLRT